MKTRDWLLDKLIGSATKRYELQADTLQQRLNSVQEENDALKNRIADLAPQKQFVIRESSLVGDSAIRTVQSVRSSNGITTITL